MNAQKKITALALAGMLLLAGCVQYIASPSPINAHPNDTFTVSIALDHCIGPIPLVHSYICMDTSDVYGVGFDLQYDPAVIQFQSVDVSGSVLHSVAAKTGFRNSATDNGKLVVGVSKLGPVPGEEGQGLIATVTFKAVAPGATQINFADPHMVDSTGKFLIGWPWYAATLVPASVTVTP